MKNLFLVTLALVFLFGCTSEPTKPAETAKPPAPKIAELVTGRVAFQKTYIAAHGWARDAQPFRLESQLTTDGGNGKDGKSAVWRAGFASVLQRSTKPYIWSGSVAADAPSAGISPGTEDSYNPSNSSTQTFDIAFLKIDSDKALEVAEKHGGDKVMAKTPDTPIMYALDWSRPTSELVWHVIYGDNRDNAKLRVSVNASSGEFIRVEK
jgi:hypothetical protein